jgi:hypothetical protein
VQALFNGATGGSNGTTVTQGAAGNSGGGSGSFWDTVQIGASAGVTFDNTHAAHDTLAYKFVTGASAVQANVQWQGSIVNAMATCWFRLYVFTPSSFATAPSIVRMLDATGATQCARFAWDATGHVLIRNTANTQVAVTTNAMATSTMYRLEGFCTVGATGTAEVKFWSSVESAGAPVETLTTSAQNYSTNNVGNVEFGQVAALANMPAWWADEIGINDAAYLGPWQPPLPLLAPRHRVYLMPRRGQPTVVPPAQLLAPQLQRPPRPKALRPAVAHVQPPVPPQRLPLPQPPARARRVFWLPRSRSAMPVPAQAVVIPATYVPLTSRVRRFGLRLARPRRSVVPPAQAVVAAPTFVPFTARVRRFVAQSIRPHEQVPVWPQSAPIFTQNRLRLRLSPTLRRRSPLPTPPQIRPPAMQARPRLRFLWLLRRRVAVTPPPQIAVTPPAFVAQPVRTRRFALRASKLRTAGPVPPQIVVTPPAYVSQSSQPRRFMAVVSRRRPAVPVPAQIVVVAPFVPLASRVRRFMLRALRPRAQAVVAPQATPIAAMQARKLSRPARSPRTRAVTPPAQPFVLAPPRHGAPRPPWIHRTHAAVPPIPQIAPPPPPSGPRRLVVGRVTVRRGRAIVPRLPQAPPPLVARVKSRLARILAAAAWTSPVRQAAPPPIAVRQPPLSRMLRPMRRRGTTRDGWMVGTATPPRPGSMSSRTSTVRLPASSSGPTLPSTTTSAVLDSADQGASLTFTTDAGRMVNDP